MSAVVASGADGSRLNTAIAVGGLSGVALSLVLAPFPRSFLGAGLAIVAATIVRTDVREFRIPDASNVVAALLGIAYVALSSLSPSHAAADIGAALLRGLAMFCILFAFRAIYQYARGRAGLGLGDVKLAGVAGLWLEADRLPICLELACASALAFLLLRRLTTGVTIAAEERLAFGAFLAPAIWTTWLWQASTI